MSQEWNDKDLVTGKLQSKLFVGTEASQEDILQVNQRSSLTFKFLIDFEITDFYLRAQAYRSDRREPEKM